MLAISEQDREESTTVYASRRFISLAPFMLSLLVPACLSFPPEPRISGEGPAPGDWEQRADQSPATRDMRGGAEEFGPRDSGPLDQGLTDLQSTDQQMLSRVSCAPLSGELCYDDGRRCELRVEAGESCNAACASLSCAGAWRSREERCEVGAPFEEQSCEETEGLRYCVCSLEPVDALPAKPQEDRGCETYPFSAEALLDERLGYGARAQGGDPAQIYHVTTLAERGPGSLREALESQIPYWIVFDVEGVFRHEDPPQIRVHSFKTLDGRGRRVQIEGQLLFEHTREVIISDVTIVNGLEGYCLPQGAAIAFRGLGADDPDQYSTRNLWLHHIESFDSGQPLLDGTGVSDLTISWSRFHHQDQLLRFGADSARTPTNGARITLHHNLFDQIGSELPRISFGRAHLFNNYFDRFYRFGAAALQRARILSEENIYEASSGGQCLEDCPTENRCTEPLREISKRALITSGPETGGAAESRGDLLLEGARLETSGRSFEPLADYAYPLEEAGETLRERISAGAGPRTSYCESANQLPTPDMAPPSDGGATDRGANDQSTIDQGTGN